MKLNLKLIVILGILLVGGLFAFAYYKEGTLPADKSDTTSKIFVITPGEGLNAIAKELNGNGLIRNKIIFYLIVKKEGYDKKIQAGSFRLSPAMTTEEIAKALTHGTLDEWLTIVEGLRKEEIAQKVSALFGVPEVEFVSAAREGYLFPDSYLVPKNASADAIIKILTRTFNEKYTPEIASKIKGQGLTQDEAITLASIVEREARSPEDRQRVASIMLKRIKIGMPLQVDATIQYALGYQADLKTWWKPELSVDDLKLKSPYNTYDNEGLPPGPICNPGLSSIEAVANADSSTPYLFYISDKKGENMHFAKTLEEHNANIQKYLR